MLLLYYKGKELFWFAFGFHNLPEIEEYITHTIRMGVLVKGLLFS